MNKSWFGEEVLALRMSVKIKTDFIIISNELFRERKVFLIYNAVIVSN